MQTKILELRDHMTAIIVLATRLDADGPDQRRLLRAAGYGKPTEGYIILTKISGGADRAFDDPFNWGDRTMLHAHLWVLTHWLNLADGDVVDVRVVLNETTRPAGTDFPPLHPDEFRHWPPANLDEFTR